MTSHHPALARLAGRPLALAPRAVDTLLVAGRSLYPGGAVPPMGVEARPGVHGFTLSDSGIAVVPVVGPLVSRGDW